MMLNYIENIPPIAEIPDDDKLRVVYAFGSMAKNKSLNSVPLIDVLLKGIKKNEDDTFSTTNKDDIVIKISILEVNIVKLMSIWDGKRKTTSAYLFKNCKYHNNCILEFDFNQHNPISIPFLSREETSVNELLNSKYFIQINNENDKRVGKFLHNKYLKLLDSKNRTIIIPNYEYLVSAYTPQTQSFVSELLLYNTQNILDKEIEESSSENGIYVIKYKASHKETTLDFLGYLVCNNVTKQRVSKIRASIESTDKPFVNVDILPYHPVDLSINVDCIEFPNNTFLVTKITVFNPPTNFEIRKEVQENETENPDNESGSKREKQVHLGNDDISEDYGKVIVSNNNPHNGQKNLYIHSEVKIGGRSRQIEVKTTKVNKKTDTKVNVHKLDEEIQDLSSSKTDSSKKSKHTGQVKYIAREILEKETLLWQVDNSINVLFNEKHTFLKNKIIINKVQYIVTNKSNVERIDNLRLGTFIDIIPPSKSKWLVDYQFINKIKSLKFLRKYLLFELTMSNSMIIYLLEIERKNINGKINESFQGLFFSLENYKETTINDLKQLLEIVTNSKGVVSKYKKSNKYSHSFKHIVKNGTLDKSIKSNLDMFIGKLNSIF